MRPICSGRENRKTSDMLASAISASQIPYIVMVTTPAGPGSLFYKIEAEPRRHLHLQTSQVGLHLWT